MANTKSAKKQIRVAERKKNRNIAVKSQVKTFFKNALTQIESNSEGKSDAVKQATIALDKAASKGILHKKKVARKKSRLMKRANKQAATPIATATKTKRSGSKKPK